MKKFIFLIIIFKLTSCTGYEPVFSSKDLNFSISKIEISKNDKISQKIKKTVKEKFDILLQEEVNIL